MDQPKVDDDAVSDSSSKHSEGSSGSTLNIKQPRGRIVKSRFMESKTTGGTKRNAAANSIQKPTSPLKAVHKPSSSISTHKTNSTLTATHKSNAASNSSTTSNTLHKPIPGLHSTHKTGTGSTFLHKKIMDSKASQKSNTNIESTQESNKDKITSSTVIIGLNTIQEENADLDSSVQKIITGLNPTSKTNATANSPQNEISNVQSFQETSVDSNAFAKKSSRTVGKISQPRSGVNHRSVYMSIHNDKNVKHLSTHSTAPLSAPSSPSQISTVSTTAEATEIEKVPMTERTSTAAATRVTTEATSARTVTDNTSASVAAGSTAVIATESAAVTSSSSSSIASKYDRIRKHEAVATSTSSSGLDRARILQVELIQWFVLIEKAKSTINSLTDSGERDLCDALRGTIFLQQKILKLQNQVNEIKFKFRLIDSLDVFQPLLDQWNEIKNEHASSVKELIQVLENAILRLPLIGVVGDAEVIKRDLDDIIDLVKQFELRVDDMFLPIEELSNLGLDFAQLSMEIHSFAQQASSALSELSSLELHERSLKAQYMQLESARERRASDPPKRNYAFREDM